MAERSLLVRIGAELGALEKALDKGAKSIAKVGKSMVSLGKDLTAAITLPLVGVGGAAVAASETVQGALNKIRTGTGATGDTLAQLGDTFRTVFKSMPASADQVATAIADLNTRTGIAGPALEGMSRQMLDLARISGTEVGPLIQSTTQAFNNWGVATSDQSRALDFLWKVSQSTGIGVKELADGLSKGGATFRALGVPIEEAAAMLGKFQQNGIPAEAALSGLNQAAGKLAASGQPMAEGFKRLVDEIRHAPDASSAAAKAVAAFGESGTKMADAIRSGTTNVREFVDELRRNPETIKKASADTLLLSDRFSQLKNSLTLALEPLGKAIVDAMVRMMPYIEQGIQKVAALVQSFAGLPSGTQATIIGIAALAASVGPALVAFGAFVQAISSIMTGTTALKAAVRGAIPAIGAALSGLAGLFTTTVGGIAGMFPGIVAGAASVGSSLMAAGTAALGLSAGPLVALVAALGLVAYNWDTVKGAVLSAASAIGSGVSAVWEKTKSASAAAWAGIVSIAKWGAEGAVSAASKLGSGLASVGAMLGNGFWDTIYNAYQKVFGYSDTTTKGLNDGVQKAVDNAGRALDGMVQKSAQAANQTIANAQGAAQTVASMGGGGGGGGRIAVSEIGGGGGGVQSPMSSVGGNADRPFGVRPASPWNQSGTRELVNAMEPPARQGAGRDWVQGGMTSGSKSPSSYTPYVFRDPYLAAGQQSLSGFGGAKAPSVPGFRGYEVPRMADGGIVNGATLAMIGEAGPEAVIPLDKMRGMMGGGVTVNVYVNGSVQTQRGIVQELARPMRDELNRLTRIGGAS